MPEVIINGEKFEAAEGETIMDVGRRNGAHLGFWCNGRGICTFCECKVESGAENLSPVSGTEIARLSAERLESGSRLACRAAVKEGNGTVSVTTRAELVKREFIGAFFGSATQNRAENLDRLRDSIAKIPADYLSMYPFVIRGIAAGKVKPGILNPFTGVNKWLQDGQRVIERELTRRKEPAKAPEVETIRIKPEPLG